MNKNILAILFLAFSVASLNAMDKKEAEETELTFVEAQREEDLDKYKDILMNKI